MTDSHIAVTPDGLLHVSPGPDPAPTALDWRPDLEPGSDQWLDALLAGIDEEPAGAAEYLTRVRAASDLLDRVIDGHAVDVPGTAPADLVQRLERTIADLMAARGTSEVDGHRLSLGGDALLTTRRAAELLPGDDAANRQAITEAGIARVVHEVGTDGRKRAVQVVRWGDVISLFPTAAEKAEDERLDRERAIQRDLDAQPRRRKPRARKGAIRLADL